MWLKLYRYLWITLFLWFGIAAITNGQDTEDTTNLKPYKNNILPSPSFTYSPQTDVVLGLYALYQFKLDRYDYNTRPSNANLYYGSSFNKQNFFSHEHTLLTNKEKYFIRGLFEYKLFPEQFYGIGPDTEEKRGIIAQYNSIEAYERVFRQIKPSWFVGVQARYVNTFNVLFKTAEGDTIPPPNITGSKGGDYLGIGLTTMLDKRNSILTPTRNYFFEFSFYFYGTALGVDTQYATFDFDARRYLDFNSGGKHVLAFQGKVRLIAGEVLFRELALIGGKEILRGYIKGRFRDQNAFQLQSEYRVNLIGRLGATAFVGIGNVMPKLDQFDLERLKAAAGGGLRFNINRKDPANVRVDFGWSLVDSSKGLYITFGEAF